MTTPHHHQLHQNNYHAWPNTNKITYPILMPSVHYLPNQTMKHQHQQQQQPTHLPMRTATATTMIPQPLLKVKAVHVTLNRPWTVIRFPNLNKSLQCLIKSLQNLQMPFVNHHTQPVPTKCTAVIRPSQRQHRRNRPTITAIRLVTEPCHRRCPIFAWTFSPKRWQTRNRHRNGIRLLRAVRWHRIGHHRPANMTHSRSMWPQIRWTNRMDVRRQRSKRHGPPSLCNRYVRLHYSLCSFNQSSFAVSHFNSCNTILAFSCSCFPIVAWHIHSPHTHLDFTHPLYSHLIAKIQLSIVIHWTLRIQRQSTFNITFPILLIVSVESKLMCRNVRNCRYQPLSIAMAISSFSPESSL